MAEAFEGGVAHPGFGECFDRFRPRGIRAMLRFVSIHAPLPIPSLAKLCEARQDVRLAVLFGSLARGNAQAESDADLAVLGGSFWDQLAFATDVGGLLGREPHVVDLQTASDWLRFQIASDGILLFQATPDTWALFKAQAMVRYWDLAPTIALCAAGVKNRLLREARHG